MVIQHKFSLQIQEYRLLYTNKGLFRCTSLSKWKVEMVENDIYVSKIYLKLKLERTFPN